ncbi:MAG: hypothetical protein ACYC9O_06235 [Candidatus Latescibacterota bacterium]
MGDGMLPPGERVQHRQEKEHVERKWLRVDKARAWNTLILYCFSLTWFITSNTFSPDIHPIFS